MNDQRKIKSALISVYSKVGIEDLANKLETYGIKIISTGGTFDFLMSRGIHATSIESITSYPSILGGRVKTLHTKFLAAFFGAATNLLMLAMLKNMKFLLLTWLLFTFTPLKKRWQLPAMKQKS